MKEIIAKMRQLLDDIERANDNSENSLKDSFDLFELPRIVSDVIDYLQPQLLPYEAAIYWFMFRHSILKTNDVFVKVSMRGLGEGVITSSRSGQSETLSYGAVQTALNGLEQKGIVQKIGEPSRDGTPYRILLPEEIAICRERMAKLNAIELPPVDYTKDGDFYNVESNRVKIFERDGYKCHYCEKQLTRFNATLDHIQPVSKGGDNSKDNLVTSCLHCNSRRGARPVMDAIISATNA